MDVLELNGSRRDYKNPAHRLFLTKDGRYVAINIDGDLAPYKLKFYLAGPMRGYSLSNFPAFFTAKKLLEARGLSIVSPAEKDIEAGFDFTRPVEGQSFDLAAAFAWDFKAVCDCAGIILLPGWEGSEGAKAERLVAQLCKKQILVLTDKYVLLPAPALSYELRFGA